MTTPTDIIRQAFNAMASQMHTCLPGEIVSYDHTQQKANVKILLRKQLKDGEVFTYPELTNVPVIFPRTSQFSMHWPLSHGDNVALFFTERSIDDWLDSGGTVTPLDPRKFDLSDAIAIPGLYPFSETSPAEDNENFIIQFGSAKFKMSADGTFCFHGVTDELVDLIQQIVGQLISFNGANGAGSVILDPTYILSLQSLQAKINDMKGDC